jgi:hypothetical protein
VVDTRAGCNSRPPVAVLHAKVIAQILVAVEAIWSMSVPSEPDGVELVGASDRPDSEYT